MYGKEKTYCSADRRNKADDRGSQGSTGQGKPEGQKPKENKGPHDVRDAQTPEETTKAQSSQAQDLIERCGIKKKSLETSRLIHAARDSRKGEVEST
jgi:hypothetical protein